jgi:hypothetical protein
VAVPPSFPPSGRPLITTTGVGEVGEAGTLVVAPVFVPCTYTVSTRNLRGDGGR